MNTVHLHPHPGCATYNFWSNYLKTKTPSAVLQLNTKDSPLKTFNPTARNRHNYAIKHGYTARELTWTERNQHLQDIFAINTSKEHRQQRQMKEAYRQYPTPITGTDPCPQHYGTFIGLFAPATLSTGEGLGEVLVAYITTNFCGNLAASSQILGHGQYLKDGIMLLLWAKFVAICQQRGITHIVYSRWADGHDGLRYWKHSVGMKPIVLNEG